MNTFYNIGSADISQGLTDFEISSGQDYFILLSAPSNANVQIRLNENTAPLIPIKEHWQFKSADVKKIYISCEPIAGESIKWGQADGNLEITTNPTINQIDTISQMGVTFSEQMDKIINPYESNSSIISFSGNCPTTLTKMLDLTLDCDKIKVKLTASSAYLHADFGGYFVLSLDGVAVALCCGYYLDGSGRSLNNTDEITLENVRGKNITIQGVDTTSPTRIVTYFIQKFNLKV